MFETPTARKPGSHLAIQNILVRLPALAKPISRVWEGVSPRTWVLMGCVVLALMTMPSFQSREIFSLGERPCQPGAGGSSGVKRWLCFRVTQGEVIPADMVEQEENRGCAEPQRGNRSSLRVTARLVSYAPSPQPLSSLEPCCQETPIAPVAALISLYLLSNGRK